MQWWNVAEWTGEQWKYAFDIITSGGGIAVMIGVWKIIRKVTTILDFVKKHEKLAENLAEINMRLGLIERGPDRRQAYAEFNMPERRSGSDRRDR